MDVAGSAVGIASLGIQICQGLLSYYDAWRGYDSEVSSAYDSIDDLSRTLALLKASLNSDELDEAKKDRVKRCLQSCEESFVKLSQKSQKLRKYGQPEGVRQKAWAELQRGWYPFRAGTLAKLRDIASDVRERLKLAVQVLQLDVSTTSQRILKSVAANTRNLVNHTAAIEAHISAQTQQILTLQQSDQFKKIKAWLSPTGSMDESHGSSPTARTSNGYLAPSSRSISEMESWRHPSFVVIWESRLWKDCVMLNSDRRHPAVLR